MAGTGVDVKIGSDQKWSAADYSVVEDATPLDPSDLTGGFGQITVGLREYADIKRTLQQTLSLTDGANGEIVGTVKAVGGDGLKAQVTANSRLGAIAVERTIQPFIGTLSNAIRYLLGLCNITTGIVIDPDFDLVNVKVPGGRENVYDRIRLMGASYGFETSLVSNNVVIRKPQQRIAVHYRDADISWQLDQNGLARSVQGYFYNTTSGTAIAYPPQGNSDSVDVYQIDANETKTYEVELDASLSAVIQPTAVTYVSPIDASASQYAVSTVEGTIVDPGTWAQAGGSVTAAIGPDTKTLIITVKGANLPDLSPFRIGIANESVNGGFYSSLRIRGTGVFWRKEPFTLYTQGDADFAPDEVGTVVDVPFMETFDQMYHRLLRTAQRYGTDRQTISVSTRGINRLGDTGSARYATIGDVKNAYPGATIGSIFTPMGPKIADWNAKATALVSGDFSNQAFGNVNGARVLFNGSYYRIRSATLTPLEIRYDAERDNIIGDVYRTGETIGQWNTRFAGKTIHDVNIAPIARTDNL